MSIGTNTAVAVAPDAGIVAGAPRTWLRVEAAVLLAGSLVAFSSTGEPWWLVPLAILIPDVVMVGYLAGARTGARLYNLGHTTLLPAVLVGLGWWRSAPILAGIGLIWLAHIGMDRLLGYGLKYDDQFQHTHLGWIGRRPRRER
jgi:hypothetical protein